MTAAPRIYNLFPRLAGPMDEWETRLPHVAGMGFDWIFINPIHATGGSGSLYAVKDYYSYNDHFVPLGQDGDALLRRFVEAGEAEGIDVMIDLVINHTANDSILVDRFPQWYLRNDDGSLMAPGCHLDDGSVITWGDLAELDYDRHDNRESMIAYWCEVVRHHIDLGVRGFRCDAAYQVPVEVWQPIIEAAKEMREDVVFAGETLGCTPDQVRALAPAGFDLLFNSSKWWDFNESWLLDQYEEYRHIAPTVAFPESHDTERLITELGWQGISDPQDLERHYKQRYLFAAIFSTGVMMPVGYEYGFKKRLHVVETRPHDWEPPQMDITDFISRVHRMKANSPALNEEGPQRRVQVDGDDRVTGLVRRTNDGHHWTLALINREMGHGLETYLHNTDGLDLNQAIEVTPGRHGHRVQQGQRVDLEPGEIRVFAGPEI